MNRSRLPSETDRQLRQQAGNRCGYCHSPQHLVFTPLQVEHLLPLSKGGTNDLDNLWICCPICNGHKSDKVDSLDPSSGERHRLFNPRIDNWSDHFYWSDDGLKIVGKTPLGRATVVALHLDRDPIAIEVRSYWIAAGWHPPTET